MRKTTYTFLASALALLGAPAFAEDGYGPGYSLSNFQLTASAEAECSFEVYDTSGSMDYTSGPTHMMQMLLDLDVTCSEGLPYSISMDQGLTGERFMVNTQEPTSRIRYRLSQPGDPTGNIEWLEGAGAFSSTGSGQTDSLFGILWIWTGANWDTMAQPYMFPTGIYQDIITATLTY
ncbi:MAG: spore coat protein U domain-containing protein [Lysobacteraceae bacterium]